MKSFFVAIFIFALSTARTHGCIESFVNHTHPTACCDFPEMAFTEDMDNCVEECVPGQLCCARECNLELPGLYENETIHKEKFIEIIMASLPDESAKETWKDIVEKNTEKCFDFSKKFEIYMKF